MNLELAINRGVLDHTGHVSSLRWVSRLLRKYLCQRRPSSHFLYHTDRDSQASGNHHTFVNFIADR